MERLLAEGEGGFLESLLGAFLVKEAPSWAAFLGKKAT